MKAFYSVCLLLLLMGVSACHKHHDNPAGGDYIIVGSSGGFTGSIVRPYYCVNSSHFKKDTSLIGHQPPAGTSGFNFNIVLSSSDFDAVKTLPQQVPAELLSQTGSIGNAWPDYGYLDVRASLKGKLYQWQFQGDISGTSPAVQTFVSNVQQVFTY